MNMGLSSKLIGNWLQPQVQSLGELLFFQSILKYLRIEIKEFGFDLMGNAIGWLGGIALTLLTVWVFIQGWRIATGQSRDSMMALVTNSLRATLVVMVATSTGIYAEKLHGFLTEDVKKEINLIVTGDSGSPEKNIDENLAWMQVGLASIDGLDVMGDPTLDSAKSRAMWFVGLGTGGPAIAGGTMLLLYEVALALFIGLGPIFILCLLFDQTKQLFSKWLYYGIGTMFSMAVLSAMVSISLDMVARVAFSFWGAAAGGALLGKDFTNGITSQAMQQGGMGLILTTLILTTPPMAAAFFQGTLGQFTPYGAFGQGAAASTATGHPPGQGQVNNAPYRPSEGSQVGNQTTTTSNYVAPRNIATETENSTGRLGQAIRSNGDLK